MGIYQARTHYGVHRAPSAWKRFTKFFRTYIIEAGNN